MPFNQYYVQNIEAPITFYYGAKEYVHSAIYASSSITPINGITFIGSDEGMFRLSSGATLTKEYKPKEDRLYIDIHGNASLESISMKVYIKIDTAQYVLPINGNMTININDGTTSLNNNVELLPGAEVNIKEGAELTIKSGKTLFVYDREQWMAATNDAKKSYVFQATDLIAAQYSPSPGRVKRTGANLVDAKIVVNGKLTVNGQLNTTKDGANITCTLENPQDNTNNGIIVFGSKSSAQTLKQIHSGTTYQTISITAAQLKNGDGSYTETAGAAAGTTYYYCTACNSSGVWETEHTVEQKSYNVTISWPELEFTYTRSTSHTYTWDGEGKKYEEKTTNSGKWSDPIGIEVLNESSAGAVNAKFHFNAATDLTGWAPTVKFNSEPANADYTVTVTGSGGKESVPVQPVAAPPDDLAANTTIGTITVTITAASQGG